MVARALLIALWLLIAQSASRGDQEWMSGTAFVVSSRGYLLTCAHLVGQAGTIRVVLAGHHYKASVCATDRKHDLALLRVRASGLAALPLADARAARVGEEASVPGYPLLGLVGSDLKVTRGVVSGIAKVSGQRVVQIDAPVNSGNSGGPVLNRSGAVIGIVSSKITAQEIEGVGFAVPVEHAWRLLARVKVRPLRTAGTARLDGPALAQRAKRSVALVKVLRRSLVARATSKPLRANQARLGVVTEDGTRIYRRANSNSQELFRCVKGTALGLVGQTERYYAVLMIDRSLGFVDKGRVELYDYRVSIDSATVAAAAVVTSTALEYVGVPFAQGGTSADGIDAFGLVVKVFSDVGIDLPLDPQEQLAAGTEVRWGDIAPGDRLYFCIAGETVNHAGIYLGGGRFVHASRARGCVCVNTVAERVYYNTLVAARRSDLSKARVPAPDVAARVSDAGEQTRQMVVWMEGHPDASGTTVAEFRGWAEGGRLSYVSGLYHGSLIGQQLAGGVLASLPTRQTCIHLLRGWRMSPRAYAIEVSALIEQAGGGSKSIAAAFMRAEARFARAAGQDDRATQLERGAEHVERLATTIHNDTDTLSHRHDGPSAWKVTNDLGHSESFTRGVLDGVALARAGIDAGVGDVPLLFRVGQVLEEMSQGPSLLCPDAGPAVVLFLRAQFALIERARVD